MRLVPGSNRAQLGNGDLPLGQHLEQERFERLVRAIHFVDEQHGRAVLGDRLEQRPLEQELFAEDLRFALFERGAPGLAQARAQHLARVVPLVQRRHRVEAFVALQPNQPRAQHLGEDLGALGLADAGRAFDQQRLLEREHDLQRGRERLVDDEGALAEALADGRGVRHGCVRGIVLRLLHEARAAVRAAEVVDDAVDLRGVAGGGHVDLHAAHRIDARSPARR